MGSKQGSVLGPLLFNIIINDLFLINLDSEICNFTDDNTLYSCGHDLQEIVTNLEDDLSKLLEWFKSNEMVANPKKFQLMFLGLQGKIRLRLNIEGSKVPTTGHIKLLGMEIYSKLTFNKHIETLCSKVNKKVSAFARLNNYISREQAITVCNAVILSNFNYCPLIWLFCNKGANKEIDHTHKRALWILYKDYESSFETLLARSGSNSIHIKNLQKLMTEIYKSMNHLNPSIVWEFHQEKPITYGLRLQNLCKLPTIKTFGFGLDSLSFLGSFLWNTLDDSIKQVTTLSRFKKRIKDWTADRCTRKICR